MAQPGPQSIGQAGRTSAVSPGAGAWVKKSGRISLNSVRQSRSTMSAITHLDATNVPVLF
jgi:hypothetical protein